MFVTNVQTAHRQLDAAITSHFHDRDVVVVQTLATVASRLFAETIETTCPGHDWSHRAAGIDHIDTTTWVQLDLKSRSMLEPDNAGTLDWIEFSIRETEDLLFLAVMNAAELGNLSIEQSTYRLWYCATRATALGERFPLVASATRIFPRLYALDRRERLRRGREQLARLRGGDGGTAPGTTDGTSAAAP